LETVRRLQAKARDRRAGYDQSLRVLKHVKDLDPLIYTKSSLMLGLGEKDSEVIDAMKDLLSNGVEILAIGQYMRPSDWHLPVDHYVAPEKFAEFKEVGESLGFRFVASGPLVRTSYRAGEFFMENLIRRGVEGSHRST